MNTNFRDKLSNLTEKSEYLSQNGKYEQCIDVMEEIVAIKKQIYGLDHAQFYQSSQKLCEHLNLAAMIFLQREKFDTCFDYLHKAELVARSSMHYRSTTYNNFACYYRRTGKIRTALTYLIQALQLQLKLEQSKTLPDTHLNLCAVLSQLGRHQDAQQHVMLSIILLQDQFLQVLLPYAKQKQEQFPQISDDRLAVLAIAYHNLGVEFQHLKRFQEAVKIYRKALNISQEYLSDNQQLIQNLTKVVDSATNEITRNHGYIQTRKGVRLQKQFSQSKKDIYKIFEKKMQVSKNLPRIRVLKSQKEPNIVQISQDNILNKTTTANEFSSSIRDPNRNFASRKHPRYYKSNVMTSSNDEGTQIYSQSENQSKRISVPVSKALEEFNPI